MESLAREAVSSGLALLSSRVDRASVLTLAREQVRVEKRSR